MPFIVSFSAESSPGVMVLAYVVWSGAYVPNRVVLCFVRNTAYQRKFSWMTITVVLFDLIALSQQKNPLYANRIAIYSFNNGTQSLLSNLAIDFGIDPFYKNAALGGFEEYCIIGK
jgi:hypothetical protein